MLTKILQKENISIDLEPDTIEALDRLCKETNSTRSEIVAQILKDEASKIISFDDLKKIPEEDFKKNDYYLITGSDGKIIARIEKAEGA